MATFNVKREVELEFTIDTYDDCIEFNVSNLDDDCAYTIFRVYYDGSVEVMTSGLEDAGLDPEVAFN